MMIRDDSITLCSGSPQPIKAFWGAMLGNDKRSVFAFKCALHTFDRAGRRLARMVRASSNSDLQRSQATMWVSSAVRSRFDSWP